MESNRQINLSVPDSRKFLPVAVRGISAAIAARAWDAGSVLSSLRDRRGNPNVAVRALAALIALLVAGPAIALAVFRGVEALFGVL